MYHLTYKFKSTENLPRIFELCKASNDLYNQANYIFRQKFIETSQLVKEGKLEHAEYLGYRDLDRIMKTEKNLEGNINYRKLKSNTAQQVLMNLDSNWKSFFRSIKDWKRNPFKYLGMPSLPGYKQKKGLNNLYYTYVGCIIKGNRLQLSKDLHITIPEYKKFKAKNLKQIIIIPKVDHYEVCIIYKTNRKLAKLDKNKYTAIDLGISNLITLTSTETQPVIIDGRKLKNINQFYNKQKSKYQQINDLQKNTYSYRLHKLDQRRNQRVNDYLHKTSKRVVDYCIEHRIGKIFVGKNDGWKTNINLGNKNNQNIVGIPHSRLIEMIIYKCNYVGIKVVILNEAYTSKCDSMMLEKICKHETYSGSRISRGLFRSGNGKILNADVNGALNILRRGLKCKGDSVATQIINNGFLFNPFRLTNLDNSSLISNK